MAERFEDRLRKEVADRFAKDVADHRVAELHLDGLYGRWMCTKPGTSCYWFEIVTWPGVLMIHGDMGSYAFSRINNMIDFMRCERGDGAPEYMAEKCFAEDKNSPVRTFSIEVARGYAAGRLAELREDETSGKAKAMVNAALDLVGMLEVMCDHEKHEALVEMHDSCLWDELPRCEVFSLSYLWCLHAIRWFIRWHDAQQKESGK